MTVGLETEINQTVASEFNIPSIEMQEAALVGRDVSYLVEVAPESTALTDQVQRMTQLVIRNHQHTGEISIITPEIEEEITAVSAIAAETVLEILSDQKPSNEDIDDAKDIRIALLLEQSNQQVADYQAKLASLQRAYPEAAQILTQNTELQTENTKLAQRLALLEGVIQQQVEIITTFEKSKTTVAPAFEVLPSDVSDEKQSTKQRLLSILRKAGGSTLKTVRVSLDS